MFQDIAPHNFNISYRDWKPQNHDYLISCNDNQVLICQNENFHFPTISDIFQYHDSNQLVYLFEIDGHRCFLSLERLKETEKFKYQDIRSLTNRQPNWLCFGSAIAMHLTRWYQNNQFCGRCTHRMLPKENERALHCPKCNSVVYPKINPVLIVAVTNGEKLLLAKNTNTAYKNYGLISGFMEVGETLEDTVKREVKEEVGLTVKNIRYYKSQPWAFSESVLIGFFAEVEGSDEPFLDGNELTEAKWFSREELPAFDSRFSLTWDMIESFRFREI
ncbi:MAG: NAD(+) diphosphatase [Bacteroidales bacterium]|jgi:NAD+ diphosphatase|nr:NAD(+) diphosphatase [Bacteroidales bacterium]